MENSIVKSKRVKEVDINKPKLTAKEFKRQWILVAISAVYVIYGIIFYYLPLAGWIIAFQNFVFAKGIGGSKWVGIDKFKFLFSDKTFLMVIRNTFVMGVLNLFFSIVHDALTSTGIINDILMRLGILKTPYAFLGDPKLFWGIVTLSHLWKETGWNAIIYLAAITSIDPCLYESASIDGAGRFQKMRYVTLPGLRPTIMILLLMNMGNVLNAGFELQYLLGNGLVQNVSRTIDIYILDWALDARNMDYSLGTAAGIFKTVVSMTFIVVSNYIAKKKGDERLF